MSDIDFEFLGMEVNCEYDKDDGSIISCRNQNCEFFEETQSERYLEELQKEMIKAIDARDNNNKLENRLSYMEKVA